MKERQSERGVTLIELLVGLAIIALAAAVAVMSAPPLRGPARAEADRFAARLSAANDDAILTGRTLSVTATKAGYQFSTFVAGEWKPLADDGALGARRLAKGVSMSLDLDDPALANEQPEEGGDAPPRAIFDPVGPGGGFTADFADRRNLWRVSYDGMGNIKVSEHARAPS